MDDRIGNKQLRMRVACQEEAASVIKDRMTIAAGGFTPAGYPKIIPRELVRRKEAGENLQLNLITSANVGPEIDDEMGRVGLIDRRIPLQGSQVMGQLINQGKVNFVEIPINKMPRLVQRGVFGKIDVAIVEALAITKEGYIVPSTSVGLVPHFVAQAEQVIVELNVAQPIELEGIHDIYIPCLPPNKKPIPLYRTNQRIGEPFIRVNPEKITYIVKSDVPDQAVKFTEDQASMQKISDNLLNFLEIEVNQRLGGWLPPIQSGMGNMANNIVAAFKKAKFDNLDFFCGILQEANIELISMGKVRAASGVAFTPSTKALRLIRDNPDLSVAAKQGTL